MVQGSAPADPCLPARAGVRGLAPDRRGMRESVSRRPVRLTSRRRCAGTACAARHAGNPEHPQERAPAFGPRLVVRSTMSLPHRGHLRGAPGSARARRWRTCSQCVDQEAGSRPRFDRLERSAQLPVRQLRLRERLDVADEADAHGHVVRHLGLEFGIAHEGDYRPHGVGGQLERRERRLDRLDVPVVLPERILKRLLATPGNTCVQRRLRSDP